MPCAQRDSGEPESDLLFMFWWYLYHPSNHHTTSAAAVSRKWLRSGESLDVPREVKFVLCSLRPPRTAHCQQLAGTALLNHPHAEDGW